MLVEHPRVVWVHTFGFLDVESITVVLLWVCFQIRLVVLVSGWSISIHLSKSFLILLLLSLLLDFLISLLQLRVLIHSQYVLPLFVRQSFGYTQLLIFVILEHYLSHHFRLFTLLWRRFIWGSIIITLLFPWLLSLVLRLQFWGSFAEFPVAGTFVSVLRK